VTAMILHHFTGLYYLENGGTILKEGLVPKAGVHTAPPFNVVWLTSATEPNWSARPDSYECRIKLAIPSHDRRLVKWDKWMRKNHPNILEWLTNGCDCGFDHGPSITTIYWHRAFHLFPSSRICRRQGARGVHEHREIEVRA
jgi:hypothetical protein